MANLVICDYNLGLINMDKLGYLREVLDAINRQDLCEIIKTFEEGGMMSTIVVVVVVVVVFVV